MTTETRERRAQAPPQVGRSMPRADAAEKLRGEVQYVGDMVVPGMLHGKVLRSPWPHALIRSIDASAAEELDGVVAVLTGADLEDGDPYWGHAIKDRPIVAMGKVRHVGEPVAAVAAVSEAIAEAALALIDVDYEELPVAGTIEEALAPDAPLIHDKAIKPGLFHGLALDEERDGNVCYRYAIDQGDVDGLFASAEIVVEGDYEFPGVYQYAMETHTVVADATGGDITIWATCQHPFLVRAEIADLFSVPLSRVRVIVPYLGGGFGSKSYTKMEPVTVALARKAGRPVRIQNRVDESMATTRRHGARFHMRTAADGSGRLLARDVSVDFDTGAYADNGPRVVATGGDAAPGPYRWEGVRVRAACVHTNTAPSGSYRAFGASHLQWAGELQVDEVGRRAGVDPLQMRRLNLARPGDDVRRGGKPLDADLVGDIEKAAASLGWGEPLPEGHGRGLSVGLLAAGAHPVSSAVVRLESDGEAVVLVGSTEMGQGQRTAFAQIAAEVLGMPAERVRCLGTDTQFTPYDRSTGASRSTTLAGLAVQRAAQEVRDDLIDIARSIWPEATEEPVLRDGAAWSGDESRTFPQLVAKRFGLSGGQLIGEGGVHPTGHGLLRGGPGVLGGLRGCRRGQRRRRDRGRPGREDRHRGRCRSGHQPAARGATGRGRHDAGHRQRALRGDGLPGRSPDERQPARVPHPIDGGPADRIELHHRRERRRSGPLRGQGLWRGRLRRRHRRHRHCGGRCRCPSQRTSAHARARVAKHSSSQAGGGRVMSRFKNVAVMGTGAMGPGMGAVMARAGMAVRMYDTSPQAIEAAKGMYEMAWGVLDKLETPDQGGGSVSYATDVAEALDGADAVVEAVPEKLELKKQVFAEYEQHTSPDAVLMSNTSGIPITKIAEDLQHPERVIGTHWSNPPHLIPMIEVIPGQQTSEATVDAVVEMINDVGYVPSRIKKEVPGFVENRVLYAIMRECLALVDEGVVDLDELDTNVKWGIGYKLAVIPPMQLLDMAGLDIYSAVASYLNQDLSNEKGLSTTIQKLVDEGRLGMKTKGGIFDYDDEKIAQLRAQRFGGLVKVRKALSD